MQNGLRSSCNAGWGVSKPASGGSVRCSRLKAVLMSPATPAAMLLWPMLGLTEPSAQRPGGTAPKAAASALTSMASPTGVAVPWAST